MARHPVLKAFYDSEEWRNFRLIIVSERGLKCEHCGEMIVKHGDLHVHHKKELTPENVHDYEISLNPENVMVVHHDCHNKIHKRFGHAVKQKEVFLVYGPPMSGKTSYVRNHITRGDIVVDMDRLYESITMLPTYDKPEQLFAVINGLHNQLIDNIRTRYGKWNTAWVIGGYADKYKRNKMVTDLGATPVFCDISKEECYKRLELDQDRQFLKADWRTYIDKWFEKYTT